MWFAFPAVLLLSLSLPALADPTDPVVYTVPPEDQGPLHDPLARAVVDVAADYVQEEFFASGSANVYTYANPPVRGEVLVADPNVPYTTRVHVVRPAKGSDFNGSVVIEWWNSTSGFDVSPVWDTSAEYFVREGFAYLGVTNSTTSLGFLVDGCEPPGGFDPTCGERYSDLEMSENGQAFEMVSQIANSLRSPATSPFPYQVERIYHAGQSQQGGSIVTYASAFHGPWNDGYFVQAASSARRINYGPICGEPGVDPYPDCTPALEGAERRVREDLPVPVYRVMTETDVVGVLSGGSRQSDSGEFRYYETAGTSHITVWKGVQPFNLGLFLDDFCVEPPNGISDGPIFGRALYNAMWDNMEQHVRAGTPPPSGALIEEVGGEIARDQYENALGGIRLPQMDHPIATYRPNNVPTDFFLTLVGPLAELFCRLLGSVEPFSEETLAELYPHLGVLHSALAGSAEQLTEDRFLLAEDAYLVVPATPLSGRRMRLRDDPADPARRRLSVRSSDRAIWVPSAGGLGDPTLHGAVLGIHNERTDERAEIALPAAGWQARGRGYRFRDPADGPCRNVKLRHGRLSASCRGEDIGFTLDEAQGSLAVTLAFGHYSPHCMEFGGSRVEKVDARGRASFIARKAPAPELCPVTH